MAEKTKTVEGASGTGTGDEDLSAEIARTVARGATEQVTCRRISRNHYRCNWWAPESKAGYDNPGMAALLVTTNRISRSHFLEATKTAEGLQLSVISAGGTRRLEIPTVR
jgi:hypothetical protein